MTKKLLVIILGLTLIMSVFTACGSKDDGKKAEEPTQTAEEMAKDIEKAAEDTAKASEEYLMQWHDLTIDIEDAVASEVAADQLNVAVDNYLINIFYLENAGEMTDSDKSLRKYIEGFGGTVDETSETELNGTKVGVATYTKEGTKEKLYLFTLKNKNAYSICSTYHTSDPADNTASIEMLDKCIKQIKWENK